VVTRVTSLIIALLVVVGVVFRISKPEERQRFFNAILAIVLQLKAAEVNRQEGLAPFRETLRGRTRWALVTPAVVAVNVAVFIGAVAQAGPLSAPETLVAWGASWAPRTTNGEWWRLLSAVFLHAGFLQLLMNVGGLMQVGLLLERLIGPVALATVYVAAGILGTVAGLSEHPMAISSGASGAICGLYGLFTVTAIATRVQADALKIPLRAIKGLLPAAVVFILYTVTAPSVDSTVTTMGLAVGIVAGVVMTIGVGERKPPLLRVGVSSAAALILCVGTAVPLRGVADVRPELAKVVSLEDRTSSAYWAAVDKFKDRKLSAEALAQLIDRTIRPELEAARERLTGLQGVPPEHQPLVAAAHQYCRLREESWRLRAEGLRKTNMLRLRQAESAERASLEALEKIKNQARD